MLQARQKLLPTTAARSASRLSDRRTWRKEEPEAPGCGGAVGAILTNPLEGVRTRPHSSPATPCISAVQLSTMARARVNGVVSPGPLHVSRGSWKKEGLGSLCGGLGPNLVAVAPSRAIYFAAYSNRKEKFNGLFDIDSTQVHMISAAMTGIYCIFLPEKRVRSCHLMLPIRRSRPAWTNLNLILPQAQPPTPFGL